MGVLTNKLLSKFLPCSLLVILLTSCEMIWLPHSPQGYILPKPHRIILDKKLNEISGLWFLPEERAMLTIADNKQKIYKLSPEGQVSNYFEEDFAKQQDFEDVVKADGVVYALVSNGTIISIRNTDSGLVVTHHPFWSEEKNDFETLYYDPDARGLIMVCKSCAFERGKDVRTAFRFDLATQRFDNQPYYAIASKSVRDILKDGKIDFNPSAAAIHPIEKRLYILSSAGQLLVIADTKGRVQEAYRLKPNFYPQAEGIAFASNGDMYVANEAKYGKPSLLIITYKHK
jgi:uncharacterized protein YjiK